VNAVFYRRISYTSYNAAGEESLHKLVGAFIMVRFVGRYFFLEQSTKCKGLNNWTTRRNSAIALTFTTYHIKKQEWQKVLTNRGCTASSRNEYQQDSLTKSSSIRMPAQLWVQMLTRTSKSMNTKKINVRTQNKHYTRTANNFKPQIYLCAFMVI
jgi:hypothetical protein